jgi:hypothetical protein
MTTTAPKAQKAPRCGVFGGRTDDAIARLKIAIDINRHSQMAASWTERLPHSTGSDKTYIRVRPCVTTGIPVERRLDLCWRNFRFGAEAEVVSLRTKSAVQSAGFASGKVQRPSRTSARGR